jgi:hypothetical protein
MTYRTTGADDIANRRKAVRAELRRKGWRGEALDAELARRERSHREYLKACADRQSIAGSFAKRLADPGPSSPAPSVKRPGVVYLR